MQTNWRRGLLVVGLIITAVSPCYGVAWHVSGAPLGSGGSSLDFNGFEFIETGIGLTSLPRPQDRTPGNGTTGQYTMSFWLQSDDNRAFGGETWIAGQTSLGLHLGLRNGGKLHQAHWSADHSGATTIPEFDGTTPATDAASWVHATYTYNPALLSDHGRIFFNGQFDGAASKAHVNSLGDFILGGRNGETDNAWDGRIDDVALWETVLPDNQIAMLASGTLPSELPTPAGLFFDFNEGQGFEAQGVGAGAWDAGANHSITLPFDTTWPAPPPLCDLDGDLDCDLDDIDQLFAEDGDLDEWLVQASGTPNPANPDAEFNFILGDLDLDGRIKSSDLSFILNNYNKSGGTAATYGGGDINGDGMVDSTDLGVVLINFDYETPLATQANPVPEPSGWMVLIAGCLIVRLAEFRRTI